MDSFISKGFKIITQAVLDIFKAFTSPGATICRQGVYAALPTAWKYRKEALAQLGVPIDAIPCIDMASEQSPDDADKPHGAVKCQDIIQQAEDLISGAGLLTTEVWFWVFSQPGSRLAGRLAIGYYLTYLLSMVKIGNGSVLDPTGNGRIKRRRVAKCNEAMVRLRFMVPTMSKEGARQYEFIDDCWIIYLSGNYFQGVKMPSNLNLIRNKGEEVVDQNPEVVNLTADYYDWDL